MVLCPSLPTLLAVFAGLLSCSLLVTSSYYTRQNVFYRNIKSEKEAVCRTIPGLKSTQLKLCFRQPDAVNVALEGLSLAIKECQYQFQNHRWNCSALSTRTRYPYSSAIFQRGFRESGFAYAITSAGVTAAIARACSKGSLLQCGCGNPGKSHIPLTSTWKWSGCSDNIRFGMRFARSFLDAKERAQDIHSTINLHNNKAGRLAVESAMQVKCKCHGLSGSCAMRTCWRTIPDFRQIGTIIKEKFKNAILVDQTNQANVDRRKKNNKKKFRRKLKLGQLSSPGKKRKSRLASELLYYERSPNFCEPQKSLDILGTTGRFCNLTSSDQSSCSSLCCGRGYNKIRQTKLIDTKCKFQWCCEVICQKENVTDFVSICK